MRLIAKVIRMSQHCNKLTTVQDILITRVTFFGFSVQNDTLYVTQTWLSKAKGLMRLMPL